VRKGKGESEREIKRKREGGSGTEILDRERGKERGWQRK
jgi:hypothetical protein